MLWLQVLEEGMQRPVDSVFEWLSEDPIAAASLGQVCLQLLPLLPIDCCLLSLSLPPVDCLLLSLPLLVFSLSRYSFLPVLLCPCTSW